MSEKLEASREAIARIIDPKGWKDFDIVAERQANPQEGDAWSKYWHDLAWSARNSADISLAKADTILSTLKAAEGGGAEPKTDDRFIWRDIETAPRDGTWMLIEGEMAGGDTSSVRVAQYCPMRNEIAEYEWRVLVLGRIGYGDDDGAEIMFPEFDWVSEGRISQWMPFAAIKAAPTDLPHDSGREP